MKAVVFVDVQKDFIDGALRNDKAIEVTPKIVEFAKECVKNNYKLYATRDTHEATKYRVDHDSSIDLGSTLVPVSGYFATLEGKKLPIEHCIEGTDGWMIDKRLAEVLDDNVTIINKPTFGSFDLADIIKEDIQSSHVLDNIPHEKHFVEMYEQLEEIVICGFVSSICIAANAIILRAKFPNTKITIMKDLCAGITDEDHDAAMKVLEMQQIDIIER